jgi:4-carboxymuconolactone decarboxylase
VRTVLTAMRRGNTAIPNITAVMAHHPALNENGINTAAVFRNGVLPARERELVILRVGWRCHAIYEFSQHIVIGSREGLSEQDIATVALWSSPPGSWSDDDRTLMAMTDELCDDDCVSESTWQRLRRRWNNTELVELVALVGYYRMLSGILNTFGVPLDDDLPLPAWAGPAGSS